MRTVSCFSATLTFIFCHPISWESEDLCPGFRTSTAWWGPLVGVKDALGDVACRLRSWPDRYGWPRGGDWMNARGKDRPGGRRGADPGLDPCPGARASNSCVQSAEKRPGFVYEPAATVLSHGAYMRWWACGTGVRVPVGRRTRRRLPVICSRGGGCGGRRDASRGPATARAVMDRREGTGPGRTPERTPCRTGRTVSARGAPVCGRPRQLWPEADGLLRVSGRP